MREELKPCPFCGGAAALERKGDSKVSTIVSCENCGATLENGETFNHGAAWNTRPEAAQVRVKPLEWKARDFPDQIGAIWDCISPMPDYTIYRIEGSTDGSFYLDDTIGGPIGKYRYDSFNEAKAAAQTDFERRIRAALEPDTVTGWQDISTESKAVEALQQLKDNATGQWVPSSVVHAIVDAALPPAPEKEG